VTFSPIRRTTFVALIAACGTGTLAHAQGIVTDSVVRVVPGPLYQALAGQTWLFGSGYRDLWADTIAVRQLDLAQSAGGLTAVCSPPTLLSSDIRFLAADGSSWTFSSLDKPFAARYLPPSLYRSVAGRLAQDIIASTHPAAAAIAPPFYQALDIPYPDVRLIALPRDRTIADFDGAYGGMPGWLGPEKAAGNVRVPGLAPIREIITTQELWRRIQQPTDAVDARAYLASRLLDVLVGETTVDHNHLRWGRAGDPAGMVWRPIPWDRGNAFADFDGFGRWYLRFYFPPLVRFEDSYPSIFGLTFQGSAMDRRFLAGLGPAAWDSVVATIQAHVTDSLIEAAVARMPPEMYRQDGAELSRILKARRDRLPGAAEEYYRLLAGWVDVHLTGDGSIVEVTRMSEGQLAVTAWRAGPNGMRRDSVPSYSRVFHHDETREVRLYLDGRRDHVTIRGEGEPKILLRIIRDSDGDTIDPEHAKAVDVRTRSTDARDEDSDDFVTTILAPRFGGHVNLHRRPSAASHECTPAPPRAPPSLKSPPRDWGSVWLPVPALGYVSGLGIYAGLGVSRTDYAFRSYPFKAQHVLWGGWATSPNSFFAEYYSDVRNVVGPFGAYLGGMVSGVSNPEFYGLGNESTNTQPPSFYQIDQIEALVTPLVTLNPMAYTQIAAGVYYRASNTTTGQGNIIDAQQPFGSGRVDDLGLAAWLKYDSYNGQIATPGGIQLNVGVQAGTAAGDSTFATLTGDLLGFRSTDALPGHPTLILRAGGQVNGGSYPFYSAAFLGGTDNLKGYAPNRFAGDASVYLNSELRLLVGKMHWPLYANFGISGIADVGRVFLRGESSRRWHGGFGGGIWFGVLPSGEGLSLALVDGESLRLYISTGFILKKKRLR